MEASGGPLTEKMRSLRSDRATWAHVEVVDVQWLAACTAKGTREAEHRFRVLQPVGRGGMCARTLSGSYK